MTGSLSDSLPGVTPDDWAKDFLTGLGVPASPANVTFISKWEALESGGGGGLFNPLNSVQQAPGSTQLNSVGVQNYPDYQTGIAASVQTFKGSLWGPMVAALGRNDQQGAQDAINAAYKTWKGGPLNITGAASPANVAGDGSAELTSADTSADDHCLLKIPGTSVFGVKVGGNCLIDTSQGRALLGGVSMLGGLLLIVVGLGFVAVGKNAGTISKVAALA